MSSELTPGEPGTSTDPEWVLRTWSDVATGDQVRLPGTEHTAVVAQRYRPADRRTATERKGEPPRHANTWHAVAGEKHWDDRYVKPGEVCVVLDGTDARPRFMEPSAEVEIWLSPAEIAAIETLGWPNRIEQTTR